MTCIADESEHLGDRLRLHIVSYNGTCLSGRSTQAVGDEVSSQDKDQRTQVAYGGFSSMIPTRALFLDLDGTLLDDSPQQEAINRTCEEVAEMRPGLDAVRLAEANWRVWEAYWPSGGKRLYAWQNGRCLRKPRSLASYIADLRMRGRIGGAARGTDSWPVRPGGLPSLRRRPRIPGVSDGSSRSHSSHYERGFRHPA